MAHEQNAANGIGELVYISGLPISLPFHRGHSQVPAGLRLVPGLPGELDAMMERGELAAAPISSLEYIRRRDRYVLVPNLSISSWGRIGSATLFSKVPFSKLDGDTVALPRAGATSNALIQLLLQKMFGVNARYEETEGKLSELLANHPAALVIGDQAILENRKTSELLQLDLGEAWWQMMQTPMVHTVWACQKSLPQAQIESFSALFAQAKEAGKQHHAEIINEASTRLGLPLPEVEAYFALLNYDLAPVHEASINLFADFLADVPSLA
jgi:chorismate dehydratase